MAIHLCWWNLGCFLFLRVSKLLWRTFFFLHMSLSICGNPSVVHNPWNRIAVSKGIHILHSVVLEAAHVNGSFPFNVQLETAFSAASFLSIICILKIIICLILCKIESNEIQKSFSVKQSLIWTEKELVFCTCGVMGAHWLIVLVKKETSYVIVTHYFLCQHQCINNVEVPTNIIHLLLWNLSQLEILIDEILLTLGAKVLFICIKVYWLCVKDLNWISDSVWDLVFILKKCEVSCIVEIIHIAMSVCTL